MQNLVATCHIVWAYAGGPKTSGLWKWVLITWTFSKSLNFILMFLVFFKYNVKNVSQKFEYYFFQFLFSTCVGLSNLILMIHKYELRFVAFTISNLCLWM